MNPLYMLAYKEPQYVTLKKYLSEQAAMAPAAESNKVSIP
jgi:hypothetical protein